jgi:hypothetical protein
MLNISKDFKIYCSYSRHSLIVTNHATMCSQQHCSILRKIIPTTYKLLEIKFAILSKFIVFYESFGHYFPEV